MHFAFAKFGLCLQTKGLWHIWANSVQVHNAKAIIRCRITSIRYFPSILLSANYHFFAGADLGLGPGGEGGEVLVVYTPIHTCLEN